LNTSKLALVTLVFIAVLLFSHFALRSDDSSSLVKASEVRVFEHAIVNGTDNATCVCSGDVDGDGFSDVIVAKDGVGLSWYRYPGWNNYSIGLFDWQSEEIVCADINGDGYLDVVGGDGNNNVYWYENPGSNGNVKGVWVSHFIGNCIYPLWGGLAVADFNNDGKLDVVVRADPGWGGKGEVSVFVQNSSSWSNVITMDVRSHDGLAVGDLDRDGSPDVVLNGFWLKNPFPDLSGNWTVHNIDSKWWNQSTGSWTDNNARVVVVDLNRDGRLDVLFSQAEAAGFPVSWYESSDPKNDPWVEHIIGYVDCCHTLLVGDMNHDGYLDVVAAKFERSDGLIPPPYPIKVFYNNGDSLRWNESVVSDVGLYKGVLGDIGNDGYLDIIGSHGYLISPVEIWVNSPNSTPNSTPTSTPTPTATQTLIPSPPSSPSPSPISTLTATPTTTPTPSESPTPTSTPTSTPSPTSTATPTPSPTATSNPTPRPTLSSTSKVTPSPTLKSTPTPNLTLTPTSTPKPSQSLSPSVSPTPSPKPTTNLAFFTPETAYALAAIAMVAVAIAAIIAKTIPVSKRQKK
jgi:hypothetical protein